MELNGEALKKVAGGFCYFEGIDPDCPENTSLGATLKVLTRGCNEIGPVFLLAIIIIKE